MGNTGLSIWRSLFQLLKRAQAWRTEALRKEKDYYRVIIPRMARENNIEWYTGSDTLTASFTQAKFVNKMRKFAETDERVEILAENSDGSILVHFPVEYLKLSPKRKTEMSPERKEMLRLRILKAQESRRKKDGDNS